jgi:hypothetical protein
MFDAADGVRMIGISRTRVGAGVCMNDLGGTCEGAGVKILSCVEGFDCVRAICCSGVGGIEIGETIDPCCGLPVESGVATGNFGLTAIVGSAEVPGSALLFSCVGLLEFWEVDVGVPGAGGVVARLF